MILHIDNHPFHFEMENLCRIFFPEEKIEKTNRPVAGEQPAGLVVTTSMAFDGEATVLTARIGTLCSTGQVAAPVERARDMCEYTLGLALYRVLVRYTGYTPAWGILTGVRPAKLMNRLSGQYGEARAKEIFTRHMQVRADKTDLTAIVARAEREIMRTCPRNAFSLYISIPFCPSRCSYCSFVSHSIQNAGELIEPYVSLLCREISHTAHIARECGLQLESVYIGGGTPTTLTAAQITKLMDAVSASFALNAIREYTVEAGRPDTITAAKLEAIRRGGAQRVSINPQTFSDAVLRAIGRRHTAEQTLEAYRLARGCGFSVVNMDLIAGLPADTYESFRASVETALELAPENLTVHTLALKRSSSIVTAREDVRSGAALTGRMLDLVRERCTQSGYAPYYMYRQSRSLGNLENVGWARPGTACAYNVFMMEESQSVLAVGAGAVTKLKDPGSEYLERIFNYKYPYEYINRFDEMLRRKERIKGFCEAYLS